MEAYGFGNWLDDDAETAERHRDTTYVQTLEIRLRSVRQYFCTTMTISLKPDVLRHVVDVHCHPTDAGDIPPEAMETLEITICAMASMQSDQQRVAALAEAYPDKVIPCFGRFQRHCRGSLTES